MTLLGDLGEERRELGEALRRERDPQPITERDPDTPELRRERPARPISAERRLRSLQHKATLRGFARQNIAIRYRHDGAPPDVMYIEVRDTTPWFQRTARYSMWVQEFSGSHRALTEAEALDLLARLPQEGVE